MDDPSNEDFFAPGDVEESDERQESPGVDGAVDGKVSHRATNGNEVVPSENAASQPRRDNERGSPALGADHLQAWEQRNRTDLEERMKKEQEAKRLRIEEAKGYLHAHVEERDKMLQSRHKAIAERDQERLRKLAEEEEQSKGEEVWQVICSRIDFKKAQSMNRKDLSKFRSVLMKKKNHVLTLTA